MSEDKVNYAVNMALESARIAAESARPTKSTDYNEMDKRIAAEHKHVQDTMQLHYDDTNAQTFMVALNSKNSVFFSINTMSHKGKKFTDATLEVNISDGNGKIHLKHVEMVVDLLAAIIARSVKVEGIYGLDNAGREVTENGLIEWAKAKLETEIRFHVFENKGIFVR